MDSTNNKLIAPSLDHQTIDGCVLSAEREKIGLSQADFAAECGHSQQYQQQLEQPGLHEITTDKANQIKAVIEKYK